MRQEELPLLSQAIVLNCRQPRPSKEQPANHQEAKSPCRTSPAILKQFKPLSPYRRGRISAICPRQPPRGYPYQNPKKVLNNLPTLTSASTNPPPLTAWVLKILTPPLARTIIRRHHWHDGYAGNYYMAVDHAHGKAGKDHACFTRA